MSDNKNFLEEDYEEILRNNIRLRDSIVKEFTKNGVPTDNRDIRVINELMTSAETTILKLSEIRQRENSDQRSAEESRAARNQLASALLQKMNESPSREVDVPQIDYEIDDTELVEGALDQEPCEVNMVDIMKTLEEDNEND